MKQDLELSEPKTLRVTFSLCITACIALCIGSAPVAGENGPPAKPNAAKPTVATVPSRFDQLIKDSEKNRATGKQTANDSANGDEQKEAAPGPNLTKDFLTNFPIDVTDLIDVSLSKSLTPKGDTTYIASASLQNISELTIPGPLFLVIEETGVEGLKLQSTVQFVKDKALPPHHEFMDEDGRLPAGKKTRRHKITFTSDARIAAEELAKFDPTWTITRERPETENPSKGKVDTTFDKMLADKKYSAADLREAMKKQEKLVKLLTDSGKFPKPGLAGNNAGQPVLGNNSFNGVAIGETPTGQLAFLVFGPRHGLKNQLPESFEGIPVQLRVTAPIFSGPAGGNGKGGKGKIVPIPGDDPISGPGGNPRIRFDRPVPIGISTSNLTDVCLSGTLGFRAKKRDNGDVMMISNNHVWAKENLAQKGQTILQPSRGDSSCIRDTNNSIGAFDSFIEIKFDGSDNILDAAMSSVEDGAVAGSTPDDGYGFPEEKITQPLINMQVQKYGRTTGFTKGRIFAINANIRVGYDAGVARFVRQIGYRGSDGVDFSKPGDSGSLVVSDPGREPVALNFAGAGADSFGNPIQDVLDAFNVDVFGEKKDDEEDGDGTDPPPNNQAPVVQIAANFPGTNFNQSGFIPPDTMGAVGPSHVVELINGQYAVYDKTGTLIVRSSLDAFWVNAGVNPVRFSFDPRILYDTSTSRFFACAVDNAGAENNFLVAVSNTSDPSDGWAGFQIDADSDDVEWADFPMLGLNAEVVTISANMFPIGNGGSNASFLVIPKADLIAGSVANATLIENVNFNETGFTPQPIVDLDNGNFPQEILSSFNKTSGFLKTSSLLGPAASPTLSTAGGFINVTPRNRPPLIDQPGPKVDIQASDNRFNGNVVKQLISGRTNPSLWGAHTVNINGRAAIEWYEIDAVTNAILQSGTIEDPVLAFNYPSIAVNDDGVVVIGFSGGSPSQFMSTYAIAGRTVAGVTTFDPFFLTRAGVADYQRLDSIGRNRWGDYSATVIDPTDSNVFWTFQLACSATDQWEVQITRLNAGPPGPDPDPGDASIGDRIFVDANQNGLQDSGERGADQVGVELFSVGADGTPQTGDDTSIGTVTTDRSGRYRFDNLDAGSYYIQVTANSANFSFTTQNVGNDERRDSDVNDQGISDVVDLAESERYTSLDAGLTLINDPGRGRIGNFVWFDRTQDGIYTSRERGAPGVLVRLFSAGNDGVKSADDQLINQRRTNRRGLYVFFGLPAGSYYVEFEPPANATFTTKDQPGRGGDRRDSDVDPATGQTDVFQLFPNETNLNIDAGIIPSNN